MKWLNLCWIDFLYWLESRVAGGLWGLTARLTGEVAIAWLDWLPALAYRWRKNAEWRFFARWHETLYGEPLPFK